MKALAPIFVILTIAAIVLVVYLIKTKPRTKKNLFLILLAFMLLFFMLGFATAGVLAPV